MGYSSSVTEHFLQASPLCHCNWFEIRRCETRITSTYIDNVLCVETNRLVNPLPLVTTNVEVENLKFVYLFKVGCPGENNEWKMELLDEHGRIEMVGERACPAEEAKKRSGVKLSTSDGELAEHLMMRLAEFYEEGDKKYADVEEDDKKYIITKEGHIKYINEHGDKKYTAIKFIK